MTTRYYQAMPPDKARTGDEWDTGQVTYELTPRGWVDRRRERSDLRARLARLTAALRDLGAHDFEGIVAGTADRPCSRCGKADRHPIHALAGETTDTPRDRVDALVDALDASLDKARAAVPDKDAPSA